MEIGTGMEGVGKKALGYSLLELRVKELFGPQSASVSFDLMSCLAICRHIEDNVIHARQPCLKTGQPRASKLMRFIISCCSLCRSAFLKDAN